MSNHEEQRSRKVAMAAMRFDNKCVQIKDSDFSKDSHITTSKDSKGACQTPGPSTSYAVENYSHAADRKTDTSTNADPTKVKRWIADIELM